MKRALAEEGFYEACNYSFYSPKAFDLLRLPEDAKERKAVKILNPIGEDLSVMRTILAPSMIENIVRNVRRGNTEGRLFEVANVYLSDLPPKERPEEAKRIVLGQWGDWDFFAMKGALEGAAERLGVSLKFANGTRTFLHPGVTADVICNGRTAGYLGRLHPEVQEELALEKDVYLCELDYAVLGEKREIAVKPLSAFPDVGKVSDWARTPMAWAVKQGIINGSIVNGAVTLAPQREASRAEMAAMLQSFCEKIF